MTTTNAISGQSIGTSTNVGEGLYPQKITAVSTTSGFYIQPRVTNGIGDYKGKYTVRVWYCASSYSLTAAAAVTQLKLNASYVDLPLDPANGGVAIRDSFLEVLSGQYIYLWCAIPNLPVAATLDVNVTEIG